MIRSEKQQRHDVHRQYAVESSFVPDCGHLWIVVNGNCTHGRICAPMSMDAPMRLLTCGQKPYLEEREEDHLQKKTILA